VDTLSTVRSRVFISYRQKDTEHAVGRLAKDLRERFGDDCVFYDVASIAPGTDFADALRQAIAVSAATLVVIGPEWLTITDRQGKRRLDQPTDWVAQEVASSLCDQEIRVFPVLVGGARMPEPEELPESLRLLPRRQAFHLESRHWVEDVDLLVRHLCAVPSLADVMHSTLRASGSTDTTRVHKKHSRRRVWAIVTALAFVSGLALLLTVLEASRKEKAQHAEAEVRLPNIATAPVRDATSTVDWTVSPSLRYSETAGEYRRMFLSTSRDPSSVIEVSRFADRVLAGRAQYQAAVKGSYVPWYMVGILHGLETRFDFTRHLHNGDPLTARTINSPKGRPPAGEPPFTWSESARDVLTVAHWDSERDWSLAHSLYLAESYNGFGYRRRGLPSPYLWAGTDIYRKGKFTADGTFNSELKARGIGVAAVLKELVARGAIEVSGAP
jgi:lysozyme family protein